MRHWALLLVVGFVFGFTVRHVFGERMDKSKEKTTLHVAPTPSSLHLPEEVEDGAVRFQYRKGESLIKFVDIPLEPGDLDVTWVRDCDVSMVPSSKMIDKVNEKLRALSENPEGTLGQKGRVSLEGTTSVDFLQDRGDSWPSGRVLTPDEHKIEVETAALFKRGAVLVDRAFCLRRKKSRGDPSRIQSVRLSVNLILE